MGEGGRAGEHRHRPTPGRPPAKHPGDSEAKRIAMGSHTLTKISVSKVRAERVRVAPTVAEATMEAT
eukprot:2508616-Prymnesium_polylepis.1